MFSILVDVLDSLQTSLKRDKMREDIKHVKNIVYLNVSFILEENSKMLRKMVMLDGAFVLSEFSHRLSISSAV